MGLYKLTPLSSWPLPWKQLRDEDPFLEIAEFRDREEVRKIQSL